MYAYFIISNKVENLIFFARLNRKTDHDIYLHILQYFFAINEKKKSSYKEITSNQSYNVCLS